jgi:hypothetical protein
VKADDFTNRSRANLETATEAELDRRILPTLLAVGGNVLLTDVLGHVAAPEKIAPAVLSQTHLASRLRAARVAALETLKSLPAYGLSIDDPSDLESSSPCVSPSFPVSSASIWPVGRASGSRSFSL